MRLTNLKPKWISPNQWADLAPAFYIGFSFLCPHCPHTPCPTCGSDAARSKRLSCMFWPPVDPTAAMGRLFEWPRPADPIHQRTGDTFETLTIEPYISFAGIGHWYGKITNGEICLAE